VPFLHCAGHDRRGSVYSGPRPLAARWLNLLAATRTIAIEQNRFLNLRMVGLALLQVFGEGTTQSASPFR